MRPTVRMMKEKSKRKLESLLEKPELCDGERYELMQFLLKQQEAFSLNSGHRGEIDLVEIDINTESATPIKQPVRRMPYSVRREIARQLDEMQANNIIKPSNSPWASPVVLVRKRDGSHRLCVDYRKLNSVTKTDTYPLPRIEDLLDQLGEAKYFSILDLASGFGR